MHHPSSASEAHSKYSVLRLKPSNASSIPTPIRASVHSHVLVHTHTALPRGYTYIVYIFILVICAFEIMRSSDRKKKSKMSFHCVWWKKGVEGSGNWGIEEMGIEEMGKGSEMMRMRVRMRIGMSSGLLSVFWCSGSREWNSYPIQSNSMQERQREKWRNGMRSGGWKSERKGEGRGWRKDA